MSETRQLGLPGVSRSGGFGRPLLALLFFVSGGSALLYQVVWMRNLSLVFGVTSYASSAVIAAYMAGLTLGSLAFGRLVDRTGKPWLILGLLEAGIGLFALVFPSILAVLKSVYVFLWPLVPGHTRMSLIRLVLAVGVLTFPTMLMGGTFPVAVAAYARRREVGRDAGRMYTINNLGAALGAALAGFVLMEHLGVNATARAGAAASLAAGAVCLLVAGLRERRDGGVTRRRRPEDMPPFDRPTLPPRLRLVLWVFAIQGFGSMAFELLWIRLLVVYMGNNVYVYSAILTVVLLGLTAGSLWMTRRLDRLRDPLATLARIQIGIGLYATASIALVGVLALLRYLGVLALGQSTAAVVLGHLAPATAIVFLPTFLTGATLPLVARLYAEGSLAVGRKMAVIGCLDTAGSVLGAPVAAFLILPACGIKGGIAAVAGLNVALGVAVQVADPVRKGWLRRLAPPVAAGATFAALALLVGLHRPLIVDAGPMRASSPLESEPRGNQAWRPVVEEAFTPRLLGYCEGREAIVSVIEDGGVKAMAVDGIPCSDDSLFDRPSHTMIVHIPLLVAPRPRDVLLIGLGIGFTTQAARQHGVRVDVAELEACELTVRPALGRPELGLLADPEVRVRIDDGRNYVLATDRRYDIIQPGIIHPAFSSGNAGFYTLDFYEECKRILRPGGIVAQWLPLFWMTEADFRMLVRTFQAAFPHTTVWYKWSDDSVVLVGTPEPLRIDWPEFRRRAELPAVRADLDTSHAGGVFSLLDSFLMDEDTVRAYVGDGPLHTDEHPLMEFSAARILQSTSHATLRGMAPFRRAVYPFIDRLGDDDAEVRAELARWFSATQQVIAGQIIESRPDLVRDAERFRESPGHEEALRLYESALAINPEDENARFHRAMLLGKIELTRALAALKAGDVDGALAGFARAQAESPGSRAAWLAGAIARGLHEKGLAGTAPRRESPVRLPTIPAGAGPSSSVQREQEVVNGLQVQRRGGYQAQGSVEAEGDPDGRQ